MFHFSLFKVENYNINVMYIPIINCISLIDYCVRVVNSQKTVCIFAWSLFFEYIQEKICYNL